MNYAIILAGGSGSRLNSKIPKSLIKINGLSIFEYSLKKFADNKNIDTTIVVLPSNTDRKDIKKIQEKYPKSFLLLGKENRYLSLKVAMDFLKSNTNISSDDIILTHDAARIFISNDSIEQSISVAKKHGFSTICSLPVDTIFYYSRKFKLINRENCYFIHTPQTFKFSLWARKKHDQDKTDLISCLKLKLKKHNIIFSTDNNLKITYKKDLDIAIALLKNKRGKSND